MIFFAMDPKTSDIVISFTDRDIETRKKELEVGNASKLKPLLLLPGDEPDKTEWKKRFAEYRIPGKQDWFRPGPDLLMTIMEHLEAENATLIAIVVALYKKMPEPRVNIGELLPNIGEGPESEFLSRKIHFDLINALPGDMPRPARLKKGRKLVIKRGGGSNKTRGG